MTALLSVFVLAASTLATPPALSAPLLCSSAPAPVAAASFERFAAADSVCTDGQSKTVIGTYCSCDGITTPRYQYQCIDGEWVYQSTSCGPPFCHQIPSS